MQETPNVHVDVGLMVSMPNREVIDLKKGKLTVKTQKH